MESVKLSGIKTGNFNIAEKHILCISEGKDSMATAILALEHGEPLDMAVFKYGMTVEKVNREISMQAAQMQIEDFWEE